MAEPAPDEPAEVPATRPMPLSPVIRRFRVTGKVQGVYFRHSTRVEAERLAIRGLAQNLSDGSVEVLAHGTHSAVENLREWLQRGPSTARVESVLEIEVSGEIQTPAGFDIR